MRYNVTKMRRDTANGFNMGWEKAQDHIISLITTILLHMLLIALITTVMHGKTVFLVCPSFSGTFFVMIFLALTAPISIFGCSFWRLSWTSKLCAPILSCIEGFISYVCAYKHAYSIDITTQDTIMHVADAAKIQEEMEKIGGGEIYKYVVEPYLQRI